MDLSIIIPTKNEEMALPETLALITRVLDTNKGLSKSYEIIIADENSTDRTEIAAKAGGAWVVINTLPAGVGNSVRCALKEARGDWVTFMTADGSDSPGDLLRMWERRNASCVLGSRWMPGATVVGYPPLKLLLNRIANRLIGAARESSYSDYTNPFKLYTTAHLRRLNLTCRGFGYGLEMCLKYLGSNDPMGVFRHRSWFPQPTIVKTDWCPRTQGESNFGVRALSSYVGVLVNYWRGK